MNVLVVGASQGTGALVVQEALSRGWRVSAFARSPDKLTIDHPALTRVRGDFHDPASVAAAMPGHDAVVVTASASSIGAFRDQPEFFSSGTRNVVNAMRDAGVKRLVVLSALGTGDSRTLLNPVLRWFMVDLLLKNAFADHERQEALVRDSGLEWVVARPGRLTNGPARHAYVKTAAIEKVPSSISRADVAHFLTEACESGEWVGKAVQIGG